MNIIYLLDGFYLICMNEFESVSYLLMMFTTSVDETRKWIEMITMAQEDYRSLRSSCHNEFG